MTRRLRLRRETLAELTRQDLAVVAGAADALTPRCAVTYPADACLSLYDRCWPTGGAC